MYQIHSVEVFFLFKNQKNIFGVSVSSYSYNIYKYCNIYFNNEKYFKNRATIAFK